MLKKEPGPGREKLGFRESVLSNFQFLQDEGLRPVDQEVTLVRYQSAEVFLNVYHGRASFELGVEIGRMKEPAEKLTLYDIIAWAGAEKAEGLGQHVMFQVSSRHGVQEFVPKLAALVRKYAMPLLRGDPDAYYAVTLLRSERSREFTQEIRLRGIRSKAEAAWHAKDYSQVVELYDPVREDLTEVEAKKLDYSEEHVLIAGSAGTRSSAARTKR